MRGRRSANVSSLSLQPFEHKRGVPETHKVFAGVFLGRSFHNPRSLQTWTLAWLLYFWGCFWGPNELPPPTLPEEVQRHYLRPTEGSLTLQESMRSTTSKPHTPLEHQVALVQDTAVYQNISHSDSAERTISHLCNQVLRRARWGDRLKARTGLDLVAFRLRHAMFKDTGPVGAGRNS
eukprot:1683319-Amphidinium_carterae.1